MGNWLWIKCSGISFLFSIHTKILTFCLGLLLMCKKTVVAFNLKSKQNPNTTPMHKTNNLMVIEQLPLATTSENVAI